MGGRTKGKFIGEFEKFPDFLSEDLEFFEKKIKENQEKGLILEVGTGNGLFFSEILRNFPENFVVGVDLRKDRLFRSFQKAEKTESKNFILVKNDAKEILEKIPDGSLEVLFISFPDNRPKKKEWKYRFFQLEIIEKLAKKLKKGGKVFLKTDCNEYFYFTRTAFFFKKKLFTEIFYSFDLENEKKQAKENLISTEFEKKWKEQGKKIFCLVYEKKSN